MGSEMCIRDSPQSQQSFSNRFRRFRFALAWTAVALIGSSIIWSLTWLQPQKQIRLTLIGADYAENLSVNLNVSGWNDLNSIVEMAHNDSHAMKFRVGSSPVVFQNDTKWDSDLEHANERTIVVYFSAHGAADEQGAYLMPQNCSPDKEFRLNVGKIIERLKQVPAGKKKLLVLDAAHIRANWNYGILSNDFARSLKELNQQILDVPNLTVLSATSEEQLSWAFPAHNQTAFGHFFVEAIRGASDDYNNNGRIDVEDVYRFTNVNVAQWVKTTYHCLLYTSPSPRDLSTSRMPSSA